MSKVTAKYCPYCGSSNERYFSIETLAKMFDCSEQFFRNLVRDKKIGYVKLGRLVRIPYSEILTYAELVPSMNQNINQLLKS